MTPLKAPFPYFGGKSRVASLVWERLGNTPNYVEPFAGSLAVLLARPHPPKVETVNDLDAFITNTWRAIALDPDSVAQYADWPVMELDLSARHSWLIEREPELAEKLAANPDYYDAKIAGWWLWGICAWLGHGWCTVKKRKTPHAKNRGRNLPHLSDGGMGVHRVSLQNKALGIYMRQLAARLRYVRITSGDWTRVLTPNVTVHQGITGVFLDPPYTHKTRDKRLYREDHDVAHRVRDWCQANGDNPKLRIALCGYEGEGHEVLEEQGWSVVAWKAPGGFGMQGNNRARANRHLERIWFSPHCLKPAQEILDTLSVAQLQGREPQG